MRKILKQWYSEPMLLTVSICGPAHTNPDGPGELHVETIDGEKRIPVTAELLEQLAAQMRDREQLWQPSRGDSGNG